MANDEHVQIHYQKVEAWNAWRRQNPRVVADLRGAHFRSENLEGRNLRGADLSGADLGGADLRAGNLYEANLRDGSLGGAQLIGADLRLADLRGANLGLADLRLANLQGANLSRADLWAANLSRADLTAVVLVGTSLLRTNLTGCRIYGISAWDVALDSDTKQHDMIITPLDQPVITVDDLEVAQFIYLLLDNVKIRHVIDTITSKVVLILGRFTEERKAVLDAIRAELRRRDFTPVLFDFDKPASKDLTGTVETLARMARFIIADISVPRSIPHELATIVPLLRTTPVLPLKLIGSEGYSMFGDLKAYPWVLPTHDYADGPSLILGMPDVIAPAEKMADEYRRVRP